jgi:transposase-like protein
VEADLLRQIIKHVVRRVMDMDVQNLRAAAYGERSVDRQNGRNGYRERFWDTRAGSVDPKIPKFRSAS